MSFGIDTFRCHLDSISFADFWAWNGGMILHGLPIGGAPLFAGRNFLGGNRNPSQGDFIWGHSEATDAASERAAVYPVPEGDPSPEHPENLRLLVDNIAPIQAPDSVRQQVTGDRGRLFGRIDADALCGRLKSCILAGEFQPPETVLVWLAVDPGADFSADYWAGWANTVNNSILEIVSQGELQAQLQIFRPAVLCEYLTGADGRLHPDPRVVAAISRANPGLDSTAHALWADFKLWDNAPADLLANGSPLLDWSRFDSQSAPILWRFASGFLRPDGSPAGLPFDLDVMNPGSRPLDWMLETQQWQPTVSTVKNIGFSSLGIVQDAHVKSFQNTDMPALYDANYYANTGHFRVSGDRVRVIGRYIKPGQYENVGAAEAKRLADGGIGLFTVWEGARELANMGRSEPTQDQDSDVQKWKPFATNIHKNIFYFCPDPDKDPATHDDAGTLDGRNAFDYCGNVLLQPPQTPVFFAIDFDPYDIPQGEVSDGWPTLPVPAERENWICAYFENIKRARDDFSERTGRHYLIGAYCSGQTLQLLYEQGIVSHFWQAGSSGRSGSRPPNWPWYHANRWQYQTDSALDSSNQHLPGSFPTGADPDADWGDGGAWKLTDPLVQELIWQERFGTGTTPLILLPPYLGGLVL
jgi:hypothetical protein